MSKVLIFGALDSLKKYLLKDLYINLSRKNAALMSQRFSKLMDYTVYGGKCMRSEMLISAFTGLGKRYTEIEYKCALYVAACFEILQSYLIILDDIVDHGQQRRGKPCWHTLSGVGLNAINDAELLSISLDKALQFSLKQHPLASSIRDYFIKLKLNTTIGQILDNSTTGLNDCTWERYADIVKHKTSYYTVCGPAQIALLLADERRYWTETESVCLKLGYLFQAQDDFLDCFGNHNTTGKLGSDLKEGKCTWVTCKVAEMLNSSSNSSFVDYNKFFRENFGKTSDAVVDELLNIIRLLNVDKSFLKFEKKMTAKLIDQIDKFPNLGFRNALRSFLAASLNRTKLFTEKTEV
uniref:Farnesyl pyrophosphate synthase n=1 Tax=Syphacia muris TaxID=451379 RepID=A0A0N5AK48_9BILA